MQPIRGRHILVVAIDQHHVVLDDFEVVGVLHQEVRELLEVLSRDMAHLWRGLAAMAHQTADGHLSSDPVHQQLVLEIVFGLLDVVPLSAGARVHPVRVVVIQDLVRVHVHVVSADEEQRRVSRQELLEACERMTSLIILSLLNIEIKVTTSIKQKFSFECSCRTGKVKPTLSH